MAAFHALIGFTAWTLLLVITVLVYRSMRFLRGTPINHWPRHAKPTDDALIIQRIEDAHANCLENLPIFAVIVLLGVFLVRLGPINAVAPFVFYARIGQTLAHLSGVGRINVLFRSTFWVIQLGLFVWMLVTLVR